MRATGQTGKEMALVVFDIPMEMSIMAIGRIIKLKVAVLFDIPMEMSSKAMS